MIEFKPKLWTVGAAGMMLLSVSACGDKATTEADATTDGTNVSAGATNDAVVAGGETGEAGAATAYSMIAAENRQALRLYHLKGFFLVAQHILPSEGEEAAGIVIQQGLLEVLDPEEEPLKAIGLDVAALRKAAETGKAADIRNAINALDKSFTARPKNATLDRDVAFGLSELTSGLYNEVVTDAGIDATEYLHSLGAALALKNYIDQSAKLTALRPDAAKLITFWPTTVAPEDPAKATDKAEVVAHISRMELSLNSL